MESRIVIQKHREDVGDIGNGIGAEPKANGHYREQDWNFERIENPHKTRNGQFNIYGIGTRRDWMEAISLTFIIFHLDPLASEELYFCVLVLVKEF